MIKQNVNAESDASDLRSIFDLNIKTSIHRVTTYLLRALTCQQGRALARPGRRRAPPRTERMTRAPSARERRAAPEADIGPLALPMEGANAQPFEAGSPSPPSDKTGGHPRTMEPGRRMRPTCPRCRSWFSSDARRRPGWCLPAHPPAAGRHLDQPRGADRL